MSRTYLGSLLGEHEKVLLVTHQHFFLLIRSMAWEFGLSLVIIVAVTLLMTVGQLPIAVFGFGLLIIPLIGMIADYMVWHNREYIVTNRRLIQVAGTFNKDVTDSALEKVNDVKMDQSFLGRIFDYGDVEILTASELGVNLFRMIHDPIKFKTAMLNAKEQMGGHDDDFIRQQQPVGGRAMVREVDPREIPDMIARLDQLRRQGAITEQDFQQKKAELLRKIE